MIRIKSIAVPLLFKPLLFESTVGRLGHNPLMKFSPFSTLTQTTQYSEQDENDREVYVGPVPREKVTLSFAKSSGPGGQNVNKLNTKAEIRFHLNQANWIPTRVKNRLRELEGGRLNKEGEFYISCMEHRTQLQNIEGAFTKLEVILEKASELPTETSVEQKQKVQNLINKADLKRIQEKKQQSQKKQSRKGRFDE